MTSTVPRSFLPATGSSHHATLLSKAARFRNIPIPFPSFATDAPTTDVLLYLTKTTERVPVFLDLNFRGNHAEHADPGIRLSTAWMPDDKAAAIENHRATEASRGTSNAR